MHRLLGRRVRSLVVHTLLDMLRCRVVKDERGGREEKGSVGMLLHRLVWVLLCERVHSKDWSRKGFGKLASLATGTAGRPVCACSVVIGRERLATRWAKVGW